MSIHSNRSPLLLIPLTVCAIFFTATACNRSPSQATPANSQTAAKRYAFKGKVISVDKSAAAANIDNEPVAGFMDQMVMSYTIKPPAMLDQLQAGDSIAADVVIDGEKYWLENVKVVGHSQPPPAKPTASLHIPSAGDEVPDFKLINQNGKTVSLHDYRGQTLLLTLIYTRCPFADFCPRVTHEFAAIDRQLRLNDARYGKTHLLSISFDPAHDTPKVLRAYGLASSGSKNPSVFAHWEFTVIPQPGLPEFANYFALTYADEGGMITHSLSTAIIAPDGKIFKWYHGADWQASDLLEDLAAASHAAS